jgi:predicted DNA binding CopG/RHH family protein
MPKKKPEPQLSDYEQDIVENLEKATSYSEKEKSEKLAKYSKAASNYMKKGKRITIRVYESDLDKLRLKAAQKGLPYQTLVTSILHQYATGQLRRGKD